MGKESSMNERGISGGQQYDERKAEHFGRIWYGVEGNEMKRSGGWW